MNVTPQAFWSVRGFRHDPFATTNAEQERSTLPSSFVRVPWFDRLVGDARHPESLILFAPRGYGKTSHRLEVGRLAATRRAAPALVVNFTAFDQLPPEPDLAAYLPLVARQTLESLDTLLARSALARAALRAAPGSEARFHALLARYAPLRALDHPAADERVLHALATTALDAKSLLVLLAETARAAGCASVYVLVDGVDELAATSHDPLAAAQLLHPLLAAPGVLQECGFAFKLFLPAPVEDALRHYDIGRLDRLPVYHLTWDHAGLRTMLARRLRSFGPLRQNSAAGPIRSLNDLCDLDEDVERLLIEQAQSPRHLIDTVRRLIEAHCQTAERPETRIGAAPVAAVVGEQALRPRQLPAAHQAPAGDTPPLFFDPASGDIWVGGELRTARPLPRQLRRCMQLLWEQRLSTVSYEAFQDALYGATLDVRGDPRSSLDKLVRRLRERIEPGKPSSHTYIAVQSGIGYMLRNVRELRQRSRPATSEKSS